MPQWELADRLMALGPSGPRMTAVEITQIDSSRKERPMTPEMTFEISKTRIAELHRASDHQRLVRLVSTNEAEATPRGPRAWTFLRRLAGPAHA